MSQHEVVRQCGICHSFSQPIYRMREFRDGSQTGRYCDVCHSCLHSGQTLTYHHDPHIEHAQEGSHEEVAPSSLHASSHPLVATTPVANEHLCQQLADSRREVFQALTSAPSSSDAASQSVATETTGEDRSTSSDASTHESMHEHFSSPTPLSRPAVVSRATTKPRHRHPDA